MKQFPVQLLTFLGLFLCLSIAFANVPVVHADNEPILELISTIVQKEYPGDKIIDHAPIGKGETEHIVIAVDSSDRPVVMIVRTEQPSIGVEFRNEKILTGISIDNGKIRIMDHMQDGHPYIWRQRDPEQPEGIYVVFRKNEENQWVVSEAQYDDDWSDAYRFIYVDRDRQIHLYLTANELAAIPAEMFDLDAESFDPSKAKQLCRESLLPFLQDQKDVISFDKTEEMCSASAWLMTEYAYDDLLENTAERVHGRQVYSVTGTVTSIEPGNPQRAVVEASDERVPFTMFITNLSDTEWRPGERYRLLAEAYAYSESYRLPWFLAGYSYPE